VILNKQCHIPSNRLRQEILEKLEGEERIMLFELEVSQAKAAGQPAPIDIAHCSLFNRYIRSDAVGIARRPPQAVIDRIRTLDAQFKLSQLLYASKDSCMFIDPLCRNSAETLAIRFRSFHDEEAGNSAIALALAYHQV